MNDLKVVATFSYPAEAHIAEGLLNSQGIETMIEDEFTIGAILPMTNALGGVKLLVRNKDFKQAIELLTEGEVISPEDD